MVPEALKLNIPSAPEDPAPVIAAVSAVKSAPSDPLGPEVIVGPSPPTCGSQTFSCISSTKFRS